MKWKQLKTFGRGRKNPNAGFKKGEDNVAKRQEIRTKLKEFAKLRRRDNKGRFKEVEEI